MSRKTRQLWVGNPDVDGGAVLLSTELLTAFARTKLPDASRRLYLALATSSYAWRRRTALLRYKELEALTGLTKSAIAKARQDLVDRQMLTYTAPDKPRDPARYRINPHYLEWTDGPGFAPDEVRAAIHRRERPQSSAPENPNTTTTATPIECSTEPESSAPENPNRVPLSTRSQPATRSQSRETRSEEVEEVEERKTPRRATPETEAYDCGCTDHQIATAANPHDRSRGELWARHENSLRRAADRADQLEALRTCGDPSGRLPDSGRDLPPEAHPRRQALSAHHHHDQEGATPSPPEAHHQLQEAK